MSANGPSSRVAQEKVFFSAKGGEDFSEKTVSTCVFFFFLKSNVDLYSGFLEEVAKGKSL